MKPVNHFWPFNFDAIPLWLYPEVFDDTKEVAYRGGWFVFLYVLSAALNGLILFGPVGLYMATGNLHSVIATVAIWLAISLPGGIILGLAVWWDYTREVRKKASSG
jgi:hypothetical protein